MRVFQHFISIISSGYDVTYNSYFRLRTAERDNHIIHVRVSHIIYIAKKKHIFKNNNN